MADMDENHETKRDCIKEETLKAETFPQDKGWAWVIVIACFGVLGFIVGGLKSFGVLLVELTRQTGGPAKVVTSTQSLAGFLHVALAPVANILSERFSHRIVIIAGGIIAGIGFITTSFVQNIGWVFVTYGLVAGIGFGLALSPSLVMMGYHFDKRKALANGLADSGIGVGSFVFPNILRVVINKYGLNGCFLIFGAIMFNICVCGCLFRPLEFWQKKKRPKLSVEGEPLLERKDCEIELSDITDNGEAKECGGELYKQKNEELEFSRDFEMQCSHKSDKCVADYEMGTPKQMDDSKDSKPLEDKKGCCSFTLEWRYLKDIHFLLFTFGLCFGVIGQHTVFNCLPSLASEMSFSDQDGAFLVSVVGISDMAGKIFFGWFSDLGILKRLTVFHLNIGIFSIFAFLFPFIHIYVAQCVISVFAGFFSGGFLGIEIAVLSDKFGTENLPSTWGFVAVFGSISMLINPFIAGLLRDTSGTWKAAFYFCSASALFGFVLLVIDVLIEKSKTKKKHTA